MTSRPVTVFNAKSSRRRALQTRGRLAPLLSSASSEWETPSDLFRLLDSFFHFDIDVCATPRNAKCAVYFTSEEDGLAQPWRGVGWMNPPYGREVSRWVEKAAREALGGNATMVCLLPARPDTRWWHNWVRSYGKTYFLKGRLRFSGSKNSAPFPSVLVVFEKRAPLFQRDPATERVRDELEALLASGGLM